VPFTELKIDQSFVKEASQHEATRLVIESSQEIAHKLGMKVTAEGIETPEQWAMLSAMGCDIAQGYLIAKPMPADAIPAWMSGWNLSSIQTTLPKQLAVNILLLEDEDFQRETYADLLEQLNLGRVDTAADVNEALGWLDKMAYGLVITDINLGTGNGLDLIRLIRSGQTPAHADIRVLVLTSNSEQDTVFRSIALDVQGYLTKPANSRTLLKTIEQGLTEAFTAQDPAHYFGFIASVRTAPAHPMEPHVSASILRDEEQFRPGRHRIASGQIPLLALKEGMVLAEPIYTNTNFLVLGGGKKLTSSIINRLLDVRDSLASQNVWVVT
jgi:DNA-binding response OmpR family regulator